MLYQENGGIGPHELGKPVFQNSAALLLRLLRGSDELNIHSTKE
jgi:hypothetical protein